MKKLIVLIAIAFIASYAVANAEIIKVGPLSVDIPVIKGAYSGTLGDFTHFDPVMIVSPAHFEFKLKYDYRVNLDYVLYKKTDIYKLEDGYPSISTSFNTPFRLFEELVALFGGKVNTGFSDILSYLNVGFGYDFNAGKVKVTGVIIKIDFN